MNDWLDWLVGLVVLAVVCAASAGLLWWQLDVAFLRAWAGCCAAALVVAVGVFVGKLA